MYGIQRLLNSVSTSSKHCLILQSIELKKPQSILPTFFFSLWFLVVVSTFIIMINKAGWRKMFFAKRTKYISRNRLKEAQHFYAKMIKILEKENYIKKGNQTPSEFLQLVEERNHPLAQEIRIVTHGFCEIRYGNRSLLPKTTEQLKNALHKITEGKH